MDEESTTPSADNPEHQAPTGTDQQTVAENNDNLDPSKSTDAPAADGDTKTPTVPEPDDNPATKLDDDLDDWISKRGLKAETDAEKQALQDLRNSQREYTREQQAKKDAEAAKELSDSLKTARKELGDEEDDELDEYEQRLKAVEDRAKAEETTRLQSEFYFTNKVSDAEHKAILELIKEKVARPTTPEGKKTAFDYWGSPEALPDLLDMAKARVFKSTDTSAAAEAAATAERERIAKESNANPTTRNAKTVTSDEKTPEQERLERFSKW